MKTLDSSSMKLGPNMKEPFPLGKPTRTDEGGSSNDVPSNHEEPEEGGDRDDEVSEELMEQGCFNGDMKTL